MNKFIDEKNLKDKINSLSKNVNIKKWDIGASSSSDSSVQVDKGKPKQLKSSQKNSLTLRIWNKEGLVGISSTTDLTDDGLNKSFTSAYESSFFGNSSDIPDFSPECKNKLFNINSPLREAYGIKRLYELLSLAEKNLIESHSSIESVPYNGLSESIYERIYINSDGASRLIKKTQASIYLYARSNVQGKKPRSSGSIKLGYGTSDLDIDSCIEEASKKTIDHLNYSPITTGKYLVCFKPEAFLDLINAFSNIFNARSILDGISLSNKNSLGETISVPYFNLVDDGLHKDHIGAINFDGEGTPTKKINLIENGIINNFLHSEATARAFNTNPTGHAGTGSKVSVGPDWFVISKTPLGNNKSEKLNHQNCKDTFVLIESLSALHAGVKPSQGSFSLPFDGWLVKEGEKISIEAATVAGDIKNVLMNIVEMENNSEVTHSGISPHIWINELSITGEA